ncbi:MAG: hypothetical protein ACI4EG_01525 [Fusicatenibacter sp.]
MTTWWFFKNISSVTLAQQAKAAESMGVSDRYWLGAHKKASYRGCQNVRTLIYPKVEAKNKKPRGDNHPIGKGDIVWVYNIFCLGQSIPAINATIKKFHSEQVALCIYTMKYYDDVNVDDPVRNDYALITELLNELAQRSSTFTSYRKNQTANSLVNEKTPKKRGRHAVIINLDSLTDHGYTIIKRYCENRDIKKEDAFVAIRDPKCFKDRKDGKVIELISDGKFKALVREYDEWLRAHGKEAFRTKPLDRHTE